MPRLNFWRKPKDEGQHQTDQLLTHNESLPDTDPQAVALALETFMNTKSWNETRAALEREQGLLLTNTAEQILTGQILQTQQSNVPDQQQWVSYLMLHLTLLREARTRGIAAAWDAFETSRHKQTLLAWLSTPNHRDQRCFLEAHPELLDPRSDDLLNDLLIQYTERPGNVQDLRDHLDLLHDVRTHGSTKEAIRKGYVNAYGGLTLDVPPWLGEVDLQLNELLRHEQRDQAAATQVELLRKALARAEHEEGLTPEVLAELNCLLWEALGNTVSENLPQTQEEGIACLEAALQVYTHANYPHAYEKIQYALGLPGMAKQQRTVEQSIARYQEQLGIYTLEAFPERYAEIQTSLGAMYANRSVFEQRANQERAIVCFQEALRVYTLETFPVAYAATQMNLGAAYIDRTDGERSTNLERAIACLQEALRVCTLEAFPEMYATIQHNMGNAYRKRIVGEQLANLEQAIACYQEALRIYTLEADPEMYATTQTKLGVAYAERIAFEQRANQEQAIACFQEALRVRTLAACPVDYAQTQAFLGNVYAERIVGERLANLEQAIACFQKALVVFTLEIFPYDHYVTQINRAVTEAELQNWAGAHNAYSRALSAEDLLFSLGAGTIGQDVVLREGGDAAVGDGFALTRLAHLPEAAVSIERGRARGLAEAMALDAADPGLIRDAERRTRYGTAREHLIRAQKNLNAPLPLGLTERVQNRRNLENTEAYHKAKSAFDAVIAEIRAARDPADFLEMTLNSSTILQTAELGGPGHALVYLAATLWGGLAVAAFSANPSLHTSARFAALDLPNLTFDLIADLVTTKRGSNKRSMAGFALAQAGRGFDTVVSGQQDSTFRELAIALHATYVENHMLDAAAQATLTDDTVAHLVDQPLATLSDADRDTLKGTLNHHFLNLELPRCLETLADAALRPLVAWLRKQGATSLILIPCGRLAVFPLAAVPIADGRTVGETLPTSVAPSARSLLHDEQTTTQRTGVYAIGDPWSEKSPQLLWGEAEAHTLVGLGHRLRGLPAQARVHEAATRTWLIDFLQKGSIVDASCHGYFNVSEPLQSALFLTAGEQLTLGDMLSHTADLRGLRLLILSACQTAILDLRGAYDEVHSLSAGMLQAGAQAVLAPLWSVDEKATYLLVVRFGQEWLPHMESEPPAAALAHAQSWLRTVTNRQLQEWNSIPAPNLQRQCVGASQISAYEEGEEALSMGETNLTADGAEWQVQADAGQFDPDAYPYADPIYWAGFQLTGW